MPRIRLLRGFGCNGVAGPDFQRARFQGVISKDGSSSMAKVKIRRVKWLGFL
jgi:hypothetical protein